MSYPRLLFYCLLLILAACSAENKETEAALEISLPDGFEIERLYSPAHHDRGSWVSLAQDDEGTFFACDQYGDLYTFEAPAIGDTLDSLAVAPVNLEIGYAQGLLWAFNSLYISVNRRDTTGRMPSGVYRATDSDQDGNLDQIKLLLELEGRGEHGPHSLILGPEGKDIYFIAGNHTKVPESLTTLFPRPWRDDNLLPPYKDARGHATRIGPPGGWIARTDPEGKDWQIVGTGFRNSFDIAFNDEGELFTFDSDMEWDLGMPWYRPIRVCHVTSGANFGWRTGSGKWPVYYPDNLPSVVDLGQGSPTGILMGRQLNFPRRYQDGLFVLDWSFGTMYFVEMEASGSTYKGKREEFLSGVPLPLTDAIAAKDGAMYFATGGRRLDSHLYRVTFTGEDTTEPIVGDADAAKELRTLRRTLERYHSEQSAEGIPALWLNLNHEDRFIRYAARLGLEHQKTADWQNELAREKDPVRLIQSAIAIARKGESGMKNTTLQNLLSIDWSALDTGQQLGLLRAFSLLNIRLGKISGGQARQLIAYLKPHFPSDNTSINREISQLLLYLGDTDITAQAVALLEKYSAEGTKLEVDYLSNEVTSRSEKYGPTIQRMLDSMPPSESIFYASLLSHAENGWNKDLRESYFNWFFEALHKRGGVSYKAFLDNMKKKALKKIPAAERDYFEELAGVYSPVTELANLPQPKGPGEEWTVTKLSVLFNKDSVPYLGNAANGKIIYEAAMCGVCHRRDGVGGSTGPDLSQVHTRFRNWDIVLAILYPSDDISDQYAFSQFDLKDGSRHFGRILEEDDEQMIINANPFDPAYTVTLKKTDVKNTALSPISPMPPGLFNRLNGHEIKDLMAFLMRKDEENKQVGLLQK